MQTFKEFNEARVAQQHMAVVTMREIRFDKKHDGTPSNFTQPASTPELKGFTLIEYSDSIGRNTPKGKIAIFAAWAPDRRKAQRMIDKIWDGTGDVYMDKFGMDLLTQSTEKIPQDNKRVISNTIITVEEIVNKLGENNANF